MATMSAISQKVNLTLLNRLLRLIVDRNVAVYITATNNVFFNFKDMDLANSYGLI